MDRSRQRLLERSEEDQGLVLASGVHPLEDLKPREDTPFLAVARLLWEHRVLLRKATLISFGVALVIAVLIPNSYESTVQLMPPDAQGGSGMAMLAGLMGKTGLGGAGSTLISDFLGAKNSGELFVGVLRSRTVQDGIIDKFDLRRAYWISTYESTRKKLDSRTDIEEDRKTGIIKITVSDHKRDRARAIAEEYVSQLDHLLSQVSTSSARRERIFLEQRLAVVHDELQQASKELSEFSSKNATLDVKEQGRAMVESAAVLQGQIIAAQSELSGLQQIYTSDNVRVRALQARVQELQKQLDKIGGKNYSGNPSLDPDALYPSLRQLPILGLEYAELYRRAKIDETVFEILTQEYELAKVQEAKEIPSVKVLDPAQYPEKKSWPPRSVFGLTGAFLGFLMTACWIVVAELWAEIDADEPHKQFFEERWQDIRSFLRTRDWWFTRSKSDLSKMQ